MIKYQQLQDLEWLKERVKNIPLRHIANEIGCSYSAVRITVKKFNIQVPKRQGYIYSEESRERKSQSQKAAYIKKYPNGRFGELHPRWKGGKTIVNGYYMIHILDHPRSGKNNRVFEHILVAEKTLGRYLEKDEIVHHVNGNKLDNTSENLAVMLRKDHVGYHMKSGKNIQELLRRIEYLETLL